MHALKIPSQPGAELVVSEVSEPLGMEEPAVGAGAGAPRLRHVPNAISAVALFAARLIAAVLQLRFVDKHWGGGYTGLNALSNQVLLYVTLLELGLSQSATTLLYEPIMQRNFPRVSGLILALRHDVRLLVATGSVVIFPVVILYARSDRTRKPDSDRLKIYRVCADVAIRRRASSLGRHPQHP